MVYYHGPGQYTRVDSEEQPPTTDEDQMGDPKRTEPYQSGEPNHEQGRGAQFFAELGVTGDGNQSEDVTEVASPREGSEDIPLTVVPNSATAGSLRSALSRSGWLDLIFPWTEIKELTVVNGMKV
ncbi:hypothetical protein Hamer_G015105 [Homarus americanus]|uniref:Uncharacterized protein n=1 Tax=Homarus americanus TaxID=6706 RepID=A0A8J5N8B6_HOMAM|nr:hypothetical protein Hamer_G015105 [Homarus americanus]